MGFTPHGLVGFMRTGLSAQGGATHQDVRRRAFLDAAHGRGRPQALSAYLFDRDALPAEPETPVAATPAAIPRGGRGPGSGRLRRPLRRLPRRGGEGIPTSPCRCGRTPRCGSRARAVSCGRSSSGSRRSASRATSGWRPCRPSPP
ncbi:hypothetical protein ACU4GA_32600 [Methylobacterium oryzae CBMB20]